MDSGTFDYFTEVINGKAKVSRGDYTSSEDDNILVQGVAGDQYALGYMGLAYFEENKDKLKLVSIDDGESRKRRRTDCALGGDRARRHLPAAVAADLHLRGDIGAEPPRSAAVRRVLRHIRRAARSRKSDTCR